MKEFLQLQQHGIRLAQRDDCGMLFECARCGEQAFYTFEATPETVMNDYARHQCQKRISPVMEFRRAA